MQGLMVNLNMDPSLKNNNMSASSSIESLKSESHVSLCINLQDIDIKDEVNYVSKNILEDLQNDQDNSRNVPNKRL